MTVLERGPGGARARGWLRIPLLVAVTNLPACAPDRQHEARDLGQATESRAGVGIASGPLGLVGDVLGGPDGQLYVLDAGKKQLALISRASGGRTVVGRAGHGPGEFVDPVALAATRRGRLFLLDRGNQRMEVYRTAGDTLERITSLPLDFVPEDACTLGERLFVLGPRGGYLIHEVSPRDGRVLRSLVSDPASRDPMLSPYRASGFVQCGPGDALTVLPLLRPEISRYSATTGQPLGRLRIPRYRETRVRQEGDGVVFQAPPGGEADHGASLVHLEDGRMLVQIGPVRRGSTRHEFTSLRTFVLSWSDSTLTELAPTWPRVGYVGHDTAVAVHTDPVPALTLLPLRLDPAAGGGSQRGPTLDRRRP